MVDLSYFLSQNPWRRDKEALKFYHFPREILPRLKAKMTDPAPVLIVGPRGSGKSTTLKLLIKSLVEDFSTSVENIFYFDLDDPIILEGFLSASVFIDFIRSFSSGPAYLILDEAQRLKEPRIFLKDFLRQATNIKLILAGSALSLQRLSENREARSPLVFYHPPLSFKEYVQARETRETNIPRLYNLKGAWTNLVDASSPTGIYPRVVPRYLEEYLIYGGYPQLIFKREPVQKQALLEQIFSDYINKDIKQSKGIKLSDKLVQLVKVLARETGSLVNYQQLKRLTGLNRSTLEKYLEILQETLLISLIKPLAQHPRTEISQMDKVYFNDPGIRNLVLNQFGDLSRRVDLDIMMKSFVYSELDKLVSGKDIHFWQTRSGAGVDFLIHLNDKLMAVVIKYGPVKKGWSSRTLANFIQRYHPERVIVITRDYVDRIRQAMPITVPAGRQAGTDLVYLPAWWLVTLDQIIAM